MHSNPETKRDVRSRQDPLRERYKREPGAAIIHDRARTDSGVETDPFHGFVSPGNAGSVALPFGVHAAVGGYHDGPNPGDLLCAALAACLDCTIRMIAARLGVQLALVTVDVSAEVDVRGTLGVGRAVPVGFQNMQCHVAIHASDQTPPVALRGLIAAAEQRCVVLQTLRHGVSVAISANEVPIPTLEGKTS